VRHGRFKRVLLLVAIVSSFAWVVCVIAPAAEAQTGAANAETAPLKDAAGRALAFDVVSIKPIPPGGDYGREWFGMRSYPDGMKIAFQNVRDIMQYAYGAGRLPLADQITGLPDWAKSQAYDIDAKMGAEDIAEFQKLDRAGQQKWREAMLQAMLADRFQLRVHRGTRQAPVYEMVIAKGGSKLTDAATDTGALRLGKNDDGSTYSGFQFNVANTIAQQMSMQTLTVWLSHSWAAGRAVVDKTGLTGTYNFTLGWSVYPPPKAAVGGAGGDTVLDPGPSLFQALERLGLKLVPATGALDTIVVDHVERPSEN
jgi:bla regulator protein blaR1